MGVGLSLDAVFDEANSTFCSMWTLTCSPMSPGLQFPASRVMKWCSFQLLFCCVPLLPVLWRRTLTNRSQIKKCADCFSLWWFSWSGSWARRPDPKHVTGSPFREGTPRLASMSFCSTGWTNQPSGTDGISNPTSHRVGQVWNVSCRWTLTTWQLKSYSLAVYGGLVAYSGLVVSNLPELSHIAALSPLTGACCKKWKCVQRT